MRPLSASSRLPSAPTAITRTCPICAASAGPPSPAHPGALLLPIQTPVPTAAVMIPVVATRRIRNSGKSTDVGAWAMYRLPSLPNATPNGFGTDARVASPPSPAFCALLEPAKVRIMPSGPTRGTRFTLTSEK